MRLDRLGGRRRDLRGPKVGPGERGRLGMARKDGRCAAGSRGDGGPGIGANGSEWGRLRHRLARGGEDGWFGLDGGVQGRFHARALDHFMRTH